MTKKKSPAYAWCYVFVCLSLGILCARFLSFSVSLLGIAAPVILVLSFCFLSRRGSSILLIFLFLCTGALMTRMHYFSGDRDIARIGKYYRKRIVALRGNIVSDVIYKEGMRGSKSVATLKMKEIQSPWGWRRAEGKILIQVFKKDAFVYGDAVEVEGRLHRPFSGGGGRQFSYQKYLANKNIHYILSVKKKGRLDILERQQGFILYAKIYRLRRALKEKLQTYLTRRESGIMSAMLLGDRSDMPKDIRALFVRTGTAHILAISGLHIGILTGLLFVLLRLLPCPRRYQYIFLIFILAMYAVLSGLRASVLRATLMAGVFIGGLIWERKALGLNSLMFVGCILLIYEPYLLFDVGFQLSFTCVFFILLGATPFSELLCKRMPFWLANALSVSVWATLGSTGLILYYFGMITPISLLVNVAAVPLVSFVLVFGVGFLFSVFWWPFLAYCFSLSLKLSLNLLVAVIFLFDQAPGSYFYIKNISYWHVIVYYIFISLMLAVLLRGRRIDKQSQLC